MNIASPVAVSVAELVAEFESLGVYLWNDDGQLKFKAKPGMLTDSHKQRLQQHKTQLLEFLADPVMTAIKPDPAQRYEAFPLTDLQLAYLVGRNQVIEFGGVGCHSYIELDLPLLDPERLELAWQRLVLRHDMLRAVISPRGFQQISAVVPPPPLYQHHLQSTDEVGQEKQLLSLRQQLAHRHYQPDQWPQYELHLTLLPTAAVLHFSIDLLIADFASIQILLAELGELYHHPERELRPLDLSFRDVVLARKQLLAHPQTASRYARHKAYWQEKLAHFPSPPELPRTSGQKTSTTTRFNRLHFQMATEQWQQLSQKAFEHKLTASGLVLAAFTEVIGRWSRSPEFCLNVTLLNRATVHPDIRGLVGDFIAVNVLAVQPQASEHFSQRAIRLQQQLWRDLEHADFTGIEVLRELSQRQNSNVIVPVVFTSTLGLSGDELAANEFMHQAKLRYGITQTPQVWLDCQVTERNQTLIIDWDIREGIFPPGVIEAAHQAFCQLLTRLQSDADLWQSCSPVMLPASMQALRQRLNATATPLPVGLLQHGFCQQALQQPTASALIHAGRSYSYAELATAALHLANIIRPRIAPGEAVAVLADKGFDQITAVLAVLLAGGCYVPIEGSQPPRRRDFMMAAANVRLALVSAGLTATEQTWPYGVTALTLPAQDNMLTESGLSAQTWLHRELTNQLQQQLVTPEQPAYIIYTSGTTGQPKGVVVAHQAGLNTVADINQRFDINACDKVLGLVSFSFDLSVFDIFGTLAAGACLVLPDQALRGDPQHWQQLIAQHQISIWNSVPAQLQMLLSSLNWQQQQALPSLRLALVSGDRIPVSLAVAAAAQLPQVRLISLGGPTESAIWCVSYPIEQPDPGASNIPYGTPLSNHQIYLLNDRLEECPDWVTGEMYVAGAGLALGYAGDPVRTAERFIHHPRSGLRLYRSGDLGRLTPEGLIEIQGRNDHQIKLNGHRIEAGEIETVLSQHPAVKAVVVMKHEQMLVAAIVPSLPGTGTTLTDARPASEASDYQAKLQDDLLQYLQSVLPAYMCPTQLLLLDTLPLSSNSKVDRKALAALFSQQQPTQQFVAPLDSRLEQQVLAIWQELLQRSQISRLDNFFLLGGSSLSAINLLSAFLAKGYSANLELIFNQPVFADMVQALANANQASTDWLNRIDLAAMAANALSDYATAKPYQTPSGRRTVLLTGSTGYLGSYLLHSLLSQTNDHLICLLRCKDPQDGLQRLQQAAAEKGLNTEFPLDRLTLLSADLSQPQFGLTDQIYQMLCRDVDSIIHNASIINLMDPLSALYPVNVAGSAQIVAFASQYRVKAIHYISTIGVHHALPADTPQPVIEGTAVVNWRDVELTYEQSKIMAETLFGHARAAGIPVNILRPGTITWARTANPYLNNDAFLKFYRACLAIGAYPQSDLAVNIVPVDYVADCIVAIFKDATGQSGNFHLVAAYSPQVEQLYQWFNASGAKISALPFDQWKASLQDNFVQSFVSLYFRNGMTGGGHHQYCTAALQQLIERHGISQFRVDRAYLQPLVRSCQHAD